MRGWISITDGSTAPACIRACIRSCTHQNLSGAARKKYKRLHGFKKAKAWWDAVCERYPRGFAHWQWTQGLMPT